MTYNFVKVGDKKEFTKEVRIIFRFFVLTIFIILINISFYIYKSNKYNGAEEHYSETVSSMNKVVKQKKKLIARYQKDIKLLNKIDVENDFFSYTISIFMHIFPENVIVDEFYIDNGSVVISGVVASRKIYTFQLLPILKNFFDHTYTTFTDISNGWINFISVNHRTYKFIKHGDGIK